MKKNSARVNIGALSQATKIPTETLRTWERRYNFPTPQRLPSGHRRYDAALIPHLRAIKSAIDQGYRPSAVLQIPYSELLSLLGHAPERASLPASKPETRNWVDLCMSAIMSLDGDELRTALETRSAQKGFKNFVITDCPELLREIGERWVAGKLSIANEHFASFVLQDLLSREWMRFNALNNGQVCILATPSGEDHVLGLHLAAYLVAINGHSIIWLDSNCPQDSIAEVAETSKASHALLSFSTGYPIEQASDYAKVLRPLLPDGTKLILGGRGCPLDVDDAFSFRSLKELATYLEQLN
ncbi:MAG: MerR family transcriptional regulator [Myxococcota bacterium]|nr:MerR family transcriptional regulator [Myxococcota bacterium]